MYVARENPNHSDVDYLIVISIEWARQMDIPRTPKASKASYLSSSSARFNLRAAAPIIPLPEAPQGTDEPKRNPGKNLIPLAARKQDPAVTGL